MPAQSTLQHVYATNLHQRHGYPLRNPQLRNPEPGKELKEPYKTHGLQIGDIGHVDDHGAFNLLFNVKYPPNAKLGDSSESNPLSRFVEPLPRQGLQPEEIFKTGVFQTLNEQSTDSPRVYKFVAKAEKGAILILPTGATLFELERKCLLDIRNYAENYALEWCNYAQQDTLYLITAVYRAKSWTLGSFAEEGVTNEKIQVQVLESKQNGNPGEQCGILEYRWQHAFNVDSQQVSPGNTYLNQAVFIKGFKITAGSHQRMIDQLVTSGGWFNRLLFTLQSAAKKWRAGPKITYFPALNFSEPSHPLDVVNRIILDKNPGLPVAITHDDDWIEMTKNNLPFEKLMEKDYVRNFMEANYTFDLDSENYTVCLRHNSEGKTDYETELFPRRSAETDDERKPDECPEVPKENSRLVITHMRLESFDVGHIDAGVCVFVQFGGTIRRTSNKPSARIIEWDDEITLPSDGPVHITVRGTFQLGSILGTREISMKKTINTSNMPNSAYNLKFTFGNAESRSSLLVTLERHFSYCETHFSHEENSDFVQTTTRGFKSFYSYHEEPKKEHLDAALECFRSTIEQCGPNPERQTIAYFNFATSEFIKCQASGTYSRLDEAIQIYRKALKLCDDSHQDRPATLLLLAQALLSQHGQEYDEFIVEEIEQLLAELPPDDSRDRRSADAILATCRFYHAINAEHTVDIDGLSTNLERGVYTPPYGYTDRPHLLHKLGFAFWRRFRSLGNLDDLDKAIELNAVALQVPDGHSDKKNIAACLGNSLLCALEARNMLTDIDVSVGLMELGEKVITMLDERSYPEGASVPSEDLREQIDLRFAVTQLQEQIQLMSSVERVRQEAAAVATRQDIAEGGPSSEVENPLRDWSRDEDTATECKRQLRVLISFLGGEGDRKMREALEHVNPEWPYKDHKIAATMQALEGHMPYFYTVLARRLRFVVEGWC